MEQHPDPKGSCPKCRVKKSFRYFINMSREYGICDHKNSCGYENIPKGEIREQINDLPPLSKYKIIYPAMENCKQIIENQTSNFHLFLIKKLKITQEHLLKWNCGTDKNKTCFVYQDAKQVFLNIVHIEYNSNCKRNKNISPYSLQPQKNCKYSLCLYGEHLLTKDKIICLVESEKTAIIASFFYPQFDWIATGGANKLTNEKIPVLFNRKIYYLNDADEAGKENSTIKKLEAYKIDFEFVDLFPDQINGYDLADAIIDGLRPEIKPKIKPATELEIKKVTEIKEAKTSKFAKVEKYLTDLYDIRYNEVSNEIESRNKGEIPYKLLNEANIYRLLQHNDIKISQADITALLRSDFVTVYNPFNDYFDSLGNWDKSIEPDYIEKLTNYVPVKDTERFKRHFKKMLVRCIVCAINNTYNKQAFIFVHDEQNSGKSTFCRWLCPPLLKNYIAENISTDKDSLIALAENFLINMDELATLNRSEINSLKAMFSRDVIKVRRPYDKKPTTTPRRANFIGSTNKTEFLTDETGSVRWLCFELIGKIDWNYKKDIDINNIWKQAYTLFKEGFKHELTVEEIKENEEVNKSYQITTVEIELIKKYYVPGTKNKHQQFFTATDFIKDLNQTDKGIDFKLNANNVGKALRFLGFTQETVRKGAFPVKGYYVNFN